jgi:hypothetical protein
VVLIGIVLYSLSIVVLGKFCSAPLNGYQYTFYLWHHAALLCRSISEFGGPSML